MSACPAGWHLPSDDEWTQLTDFVGDSSTAGTKLKSSTGWESFSGVPKGTDDYGFSALPGGGGRLGFAFLGAYIYRRKVIAGRRIVKNFKKCIYEPCPDLEKQSRRVQSYLGLTSHFAG